MQDSWLRKKAEEIQSLANRKDMKKFHNVLKKVYYPKNSAQLRADGYKLFLDKDAILERVGRNLYSVPNRTSTINDIAINRLSQTECNVLLDEFPAVMEMRKSMHYMSSGKAPGAVTIPVEIHKAGRLPMTEKLTLLFYCMWRKEIISQEFKDESIIHLYKRK